MIALLYKKNIKKYDILVIQKLWKFDENFKTYCLASVDFTLINNENKICFYINKKIDNNTWYFTWHFKKMSIITLQLNTNEKQTTSKSIHIHETYNSSFKNHETTHDKKNFSMIKQALKMQKKNILMRDFNLHHSTWKKFSYSKQHLLTNELIDMITIVDDTLTLSKNTITRNYQKSQTIINLIFTSNDITNRLIRCEINENMKNSSNHLFIQTIIDLKTQNESTSKSRKNWKIMNKEKFVNTFMRQISKSLFNRETNRWRINEYIAKIFETLKKTIEIFTSWVKFNEMIKIEWIVECTKIIKKIRRLRRRCRIVDDWAKYIKTCDKKEKIIRKHKRDEFRKIMQKSKHISKNLFEIAK